MENASKALIIAGAILISILLIAISMYIYNSAQGTINNAGSKMSENEKSMYNSSVTPYSGKNKKGVDVRSLIDSIIASNNSNAGEAGKFISITPNFGGTEYKDKEIGEAGLKDNNDTAVSGFSNTMSKLKAEVNMGKRYDIETTQSAGLIVNVKINEQ